MTSTNHPIELQNGETLLHWACQFDKVQFVAEILKVPGIDVNKQDDNGFTPLYMACIKGNVAIVSILLLCANINPNVPRYNGMTPLHAACTYGNITTIEMLLKSGANPNARDLKGRTPLRSALFAWNPMEMLRTLLKFPGVDPNVPNNAGETPLHLACHTWSNSATIRILMEECEFIDVDYLSNEGMTAKEIAEQNGQQIAYSEAEAARESAIKRWKQQKHDGLLTLGSAAIERLGALSPAQLIVQDRWLFQSLSEFI
jgi:ankyrin repeat protein